LQNSWNDEENQRLLDALSRMDTARECDWNEVASLVQTKTPSECVAQFLQLPNLASVVKKTSHTSASEINETKRLDNCIEGDIKTLKVCNPAMFGITQLANIVSQVDPTIAKAAAKAAVSQLEALNRPPLSTPEESPNEKNSLQSEAIDNTSEDLFKVAEKALVQSALDAGIAEQNKSGKAQTSGSTYVKDNGSTLSGSKISPEHSTSIAQVTSATAVGALAAKAHVKKFFVSFSLSRMNLTILIILFGIGHCAERGVNC